MIVAWKFDTLTMSKSFSDDEFVQTRRVCFFWDLPIRSIRYYGKLSAIYRMGKSLKMHSNWLRMVNGYIPHYEHSLNHLYGPVLLTKITATNRVKGMEKL